jgi:hypothetical protein
MREDIEEWHGGEYGCPRNGAKDENILRFGRETVEFPVILVTARCGS